MRFYRTSEMRNKKKEKEKNERTTYSDQTMEEDIKKDHFYLEPGHIYFSKEPVTVSTVVGTCVAVCIWDKKKYFGGMNHFMYPFEDRKTLTTSIFGNVSTAMLLKMFRKAESKLEDLEAQIFGGAHPDTAIQKEIGKENAKHAKQVLTKRKIKVVSVDVGGNRGRKIVFDTVTGHVAVIKVKRIRKVDWFPYE